MEQQAREQAFITALVTEHFALQSARSATIGEANGRAAIYLSAVSSTLVAFGFLAQVVTRLDPFVAAVLPALFIMGEFTYVRLVANAIENLLALQQIQRIRGYYRGLVPQAEQFFEAPAVDEGLAAAVAPTGARATRAEILFTAASMIAAVNSILGGAGLALLGGRLGRPGSGMAVVVGSPGRWSCSGCTCGTGFGGVHSSGCGQSPCEVAPGADPIGRPPPHVSATEREVGSSLLVGHTEVLAQAVLEVGAGLGGECSKAGCAGEEAGQRQRVRELAVGRDKVGVRRQRRPVDHRLDRCEGGLVEGGESGRHGVDEVVEFGVGQRPRHPSPAFGEVGVVVAAAQHGFESPVPSDETRQSLGAAAAGHEPAADLGVTEHRLLPARVAQIAGEGELIAASAGATPDGRDGDVGGFGQPQHDIGPDRNGVLGLRFGEVGHRGEVEVVEIEVGYAALEDDDLDVGILSEFHDGLVKSRHRFADDQIRGRVRERDRGNLRCRALEGDRAWPVHGVLHSLSTTCLVI
jgi:hypothetical protein